MLTVVNVFIHFNLFLIKIYYLCFLNVTCVWLSALFIDAVRTAWVKCFMSQLKTLFPKLERTISTTDKKRELICSCRVIVLSLQVDCFVQQMD
jgi:hypothetical protein